LEPPTVAEAEAARIRLDGRVTRTPLLSLEGDDGAETMALKLECLQPIGSVKIRGALNAMAIAGPAALEQGVYTGSAGNMAQGLAYGARILGIPCRVVVPDSAPRAKLDAIERLGATSVPVPFDDWWTVLREHGHPEEPGHFIHPVADPAVIAGNATLGLEILEDAPDVDTIVVPFGGGGLACGIASVVKTLKPGVRVYAAEVASAAPLAASMRAGAPAEVERVPSFVDGIGAGALLPEMWPMASALLDGSIVVSLDEVRAAIRLLVRRAHVVAEGAGAAPVAACLRAKSGLGRTVAVVSGGNIDAAVLARIMTDDPPER